MELRIDQYLVARPDAVIWQRAGEILLISHETLRIDAESRDFLRQCDGMTKVGVLLENVQTARGKDKDTSDVTAFLSCLLERGIVELSPFPIERKIAVLGSEDSPAPIHATVELTDQCNMACVYCYREAGPNRYRFLEDPLSFLQDLFKMGIRVVELSGGEPLLHPQIASIVESAFDTFSHVGILTNGSVLTREIVELLSHSKDKSVVQVSLPSITRERYRAIAGVDLLSQVLTNLIHLRQEGVRLRIGTVIIDEAGIEEIEGMADLAHRIGALQYVFTPMLNIGRGKALSFSPDALLRLHGKVANLRNAYPRGFIGVVDDLGLPARDPSDINCGAGVRSLTFDPGKGARPCPMFPADLASQKLLEAEARRVLAEIHAPREDLCSDCSNVYYCKGCYLRGFLEWRKSDGKCRWGTGQRIGERISRVGRFNGRTDGTLDEEN